MPKLDWVVLALFLGGSEASVLAALAPSQPGKLPAHPALTQTLDPVRSNQRRPRQRPGGRDGGVCAVSPGLLEDENAVWSDRPLFLWQTKAEGIVLQRLTVIDQDGRILWEKPLVATEQNAIYAGQALQPGQFYQWRLGWIVEGEEKTADYTFQVMAPDRRQPITTKLQALTRQLQASGANAEAIAQQQANYLTDQEKPLWSDALKLLYTVKNPSMATTQRIQTLINGFCNEEEQT
jgi:hypothetical protein